MSAFFSDQGALEFSGVFRGDGVSHDQKACQGEFTGEAILGGQAFRIHFVAHDSEGTVVHEEDTVLSPASLSGGPLQMFNFNTNTGLAVLQLVATPQGPHADNKTLMQFASDDLEDSKIFRMRATLRKLSGDTLEYAQEWAQPGKELQLGSTIVLKRAD